MAFRRPSGPPGSSRFLGLVLGLLLLGGSLACPSEPGSPPPAPPSGDRFLRIRALLAQPPQSPERARHLYPLTAPLCAPGDERDAFMKTAAWSVAQSEGANQLTVVLAVDIFEFVATACAREDVDAALSLLDEARALVPHDPQIDVVAARLAAAHDRLEVAETAARRAREGGSNHAIALLANIQARRARDRVGERGFEAGMFDAALTTVAVEPDADWQAIDLTALLSTRARLLSERAIWESDDARRRTLALARAAYARLSRAPFVASVRRAALDQLCFDTPFVGGDASFCDRLAVEFGGLGAAVVAGRTGTPSAPLDVDRAAGLSALATRIRDMPPERTVAVVFRGDEAEIAEWARPAAELLRAIGARGPRWAVIDRTRSPRSTALLNRTLALAGVARPSARATPRGRAGATPCLAALLSSREPPERCPLPEGARGAWAALAPVELVVLVGRDLDAELDDFALYDRPRALLSLRATTARSAPDAWFKSTSDVWFVVEPAGR